jgi:hypothetical protein
MEFNRYAIPIVFGCQGIRTIILTEIPADAFSMLSQFMFLTPVILMKIIFINPCGSQTWFFSLEF